MNEANTEQPLGSDGPSLVCTPPALGGYKFEHILISVTIAHVRDIGQFDDSCTRQIEKGMSEYQGVLMVRAEPQYRHCSEEQHMDGCECGLCQQVEKGIDAL